MKRPSRARGVAKLVREAVHHGSLAVQEVHLTLAGRTFSVLEAVPGIDGAARLTHEAYDAYTSGIYGAVRLGNRAVGELVELALDAAERNDREKAQEEGGRSEG